MKVIEPARELDVIHSTDVLVIGSGPAGLAAATIACFQQLQGSILNPLIFISGSDASIT